MNKPRRTLAAVPVRLFSLAVLATLAICLLGHAGEEPAQPKPVLELLFEGDFADTSVSKRDGTSQGAVTFVDGRQGKCASFDGRSWIDTGFPQKELGDEFTVECWVNPGKQQSQHADVFGNHVGEGLGFVLQQNASNTNQFLAAYGAGGGRWVTTDAVRLAAGRWQHVALVKTREELRVYLNGVLVAAEQDPAPARSSPMPVAVGLGYSDPKRCFRGLIDEFRIWDEALTDFGHARIDPAAARETRSPFMLRPDAGALTDSWTLATDDTRLSLGVTTAGEMVVSELSCPATGWNWIARPVAFGFLSQAEVAGQSKTLEWRFVDAAVDDSDGQKLTLRFACDEPAMEIASRWHARPGPGPVRHSMIVRNRSTQSVTIGKQATFDLDLTGTVDSNNDKLWMWCFHTEGPTRMDPRDVGVYHEQVTQKFNRTVRTDPNLGVMIPLVVLDLDGRHGVYAGVEWSYGDIRVTSLPQPSPSGVRVDAGNVSGFSAQLEPGQVFEVPPGFIGAYHGDIDDAGNRLRKYLFAYSVPEILRSDPTYPKVQWNAFAATGEKPSSWNCVESKYYPFIDDIAPLGFEEVMIDVGWWQGSGWQHGSEPESHSVNWSSGMKKAADYAHRKGMRFGLYWTDNEDMATPQGRKVRAQRIKSLFSKYGADMWRSDMTRGPVIQSDYWSVKGFYEMVDTLQREIPNFQWENCSGGGRIKDYGAMKRAVKIFMSDGFSLLHVRKTFYTGSFAFHPIQLMGHLGLDYGPPLRAYRPRGIAGMKYAFRAMSMGAPEWFLDAPNGGNGSEPWTGEEKEAVKAAVATYKTKVRPLVRSADLYHIFPRPDDKVWDGIEYYDPVKGNGAVFIFKPDSPNDTQTIKLKGLDADQIYQLTFEDGSNPSVNKSGDELMNTGVDVTLKGKFVSELIFFEVAK